MKKMKFLVSQLYMLALLALPFISSSCSDDDDPKVEINLGIEDGATVNVGQIIQLEAQINRDIPKIIKLKATTSLRISCLFCIFKHSPQKTV